jgi:uncharacterized membrane protein YccC
MFTPQTVYYALTLALVVAFAMSWRSKSENYLWFFFGTGAILSLVAAVGEEAAKYLFLGAVDILVIAIIAYSVYLFFSNLKQKKAAKGKTGTGADKDKR